MQIEPPSADGLRDEWLDTLCRRIEEAGRTLAEVINDANGRADSKGGRRRQGITEAQCRQAQQAWQALHEVQICIQNALFDCEHELRELRERDVSPIQLLVDGDELIRQYRFLRRRARVIDGLLAYLPPITSHAFICVQHLEKLRGGHEADGPLSIPDCAFAHAALQELLDDSIH
jgi:hypothetical protein